jgi:DNA polymerase (family 10)
LDNQAIAHVLAETADLLEIKGENAFRIRAYRTAAETVASSATALAMLPAADLQKLPGIGKDLAGKIREIAETGDAQYHRDLVAEFPPTILDLLHLQGVGPKTVALLYLSLGIRTVDDLEQAARAGRLRELRGMGARKEALILKALEERKQYAGRHLLADAHDTAAAIVNWLRQQAPGTEIVPVGSLRRGCETCGDVDVLAVGGTPALMDVFTSFERVERALGRGETKSSVLLRGGFQADLRLVAPESRGAAMQYFTGSKPHNIALRDRAIQRGCKLNEYGLYRASDDRRVAGEREEDLYEALGLQFIPPELRENRGEIERAAAHALPRLIELADLRGDIHAHTDATDGRDDLDRMARGAAAAGLSYLAITDHSKALAMANGLDERRVLEQARGVRELSRRLDAVTLLAGIECDIRADGTLDLAEDCLAELDVVVASVHSAFNLDQAQMTERILRAIESPVVDVIGHLTGRLILQREGYRLDLERIFERAAQCGVALEINSQIDRLDLNDVQARLARDCGVKLVISSDAHSEAGFGVLRWGTLVARRAWLEPGDVLNTLPVEQFVRSLRRNSRPASVGAALARSARKDRAMAAPPDKVAEIRQIYFRAKRATIEQDVARAIAILKSMESEEERERASVYMEGLTQMRAEWKGGRSSE